MSNFSCLLDCFSFVLGEEPEDLIQYLGHDGSEIIYPELPEPYCRRGFNVFELMDVAINECEVRNCTLLLKEIHSENALTPSPRLLDLDLTSKWFVSDRVLIAMTAHHAVVCENGDVQYDPNLKHKLTFNQVRTGHQAIIVF